MKFQLATNENMIGKEARMLGESDTTIERSKHLFTENSTVRITEI